MQLFGLTFNVDDNNGNTNEKRHGIDEEAAVHGGPYSVSYIPDSYLKEGGDGSRYADNTGNGSKRIQEIPM